MNQNGQCVHSNTICRQLGAYFTVQWPAECYSCLEENNLMIKWTPVICTQRTHISATTHLPNKAVVLQPTSAGVSLRIDVIRNSGYSWSNEKLSLELFPTSASVAVMVNAKSEVSPSSPSVTLDVYGTPTKTGALSFESLIWIVSNAWAYNKLSKLNFHRINSKEVQYWRTPSPIIGDCMLIKLCIL